MQRKEKQEFGLPAIGIPAEVLFHSELTNTEKMLFGFIKNLSYSEEGCYASNTYLGGILNVKPQTISNGVANLKKWMFIIVEYETTANNTQKRHIFINKNYPLIYEEMIRGAYKIINRGILKNLYGYIKKIITPYKIFNSKYYIKEYNKKDNYNCPEKNSTSNSSPKKQNQKPSLQERNTQYLYLAEKLSKIIQTQKNIHHTTPQLKTWANDIRKLIENNHIEPKRIKKALNWYEGNAGCPYVPVIESGSALREKFIKLENAVERDFSQESYPKPAQQKPTKEPDDIIKQHFKNGYFNTFYKYYEKACSVMTDRSTSESLVAEALISLYDYIDSHQNKTAKENSQVRGPGSLVRDYVDYLEEQTWMDNVTPSIFQPSNGMFKKYLREVEEEIGHGIFNGKPKY